MLTMTNALNIDGYTVYRDDTAEKTFYVLPDNPSIARDDQGRPIFSLIVYRHDETRIDPARTKEDVGGGIMTFTVELSVPEAKLRTIRGRLRALVFGEEAEDPSRDISLQLVNFQEGKVGVGIAGETTSETGENREFVKSALGVGKVSGIGNNRKAVMVKLTQAGAALMAQTDKLRTLPINVQYELSFEHRLLGVRMEVWCNISSSYTLIQTILPQLKVTEEDGYFTDTTTYEWNNIVSSVEETLVRSKTMGVKVTPETSSIDQETLLSLEKFGFELINKEIEKAAEASKVADSGLERKNLRSFVSSVGNNLNFTLDRKMVLVRSYNPSANISNVFQGDLNELISYVDLRIGFFNFLKIPIRVNADFAKLPIDSVVVTVAYERERIGGGGREQRRESFTFTDGATIQTFLAYANTLDELTYDWSAVVHYKGSQQSYSISRFQVKDNFLVVDVGQLGMLQVDVGLGLVDLDKFPSALVSLRYHSRALNRTLEQSIQLGKEKQSWPWTEVVHEDPTAGYEYKVDWLRKSDGETLPGEWQRSSSSRLRLSAPIPDQLSVSVVATGNFKEEISQVVVSLLYRDAENGYTQEGALTFTDDKQMQSWNVDLRNAQLRDYQYRYSIVYKDGVVKSVPPTEGEWLQGEPGFLVVGEKYGLEVEVVPLLLTYPDHAKLVKVDLSYEDAEHNISEKKSYVFSKDNSKSVTWRVRTAPGGPRQYRLEVTYYSATGGAISLPAKLSENEALVLEPVAPPAVTPR